MRARSRHQQLGGANGTELSMRHSATSVELTSLLLCLHLYTFIHLVIVAFVYYRLTLALLLLYLLHC